MIVMNEQDQPLTRSQRKHAAILEAAAHEFREAGFVATSMDRIAERAGVSKRTVYNHFACKEGLFEAILEVMWSRIHKAVDLAYDPVAPLAQQLNALATRELELLADSDFLGLARALLAEAIRSPELAQRKWAELAEREVGLPRWVQAAVDDGRLEADDPAFAAEQLIALLKAFAFWPQVVASLPPPTPEERQKLAESAVAMFLARYQAI
jgi:TetR/AcrR family transcriptional regulator of autoinduction and epiphytic fitness